MATGLALAFAATGQARPARLRAEASSGAAASRCDRTCLYGFLHQYLKALAAKDPAKLPLAPTVKFTENDVPLKVGDGLWNTLSALGPYGLEFADTASEEVGYLGVVEETHTKSPYAMRMQVRDGKITQIETIVARPDASAAPQPNLDHFVDKAVLKEDLPPSERSPRSKMIALVNGYFDTLQRNDGTLHTEFDKDCNREENAMQSTNNPGNKIFPVTNLGCADQFRTAYFRYDDRVRDRRFPVVDVRRGLVLGAMFIDHSGRLGMYKLTDGRTLESPMRTPSTLCILELFKIRSGKILQIEAVMYKVPYNMRPVWPAR